MKHRIEVVRTNDETRWLAICYECGWHGTYCRTYTAASVDGSSHEQEAKR